MRDVSVDEERAAELRAAVREKYRAVAEDPVGRFTYAVGRESAVGLGYEPGWLEAIAPEVVDRFVGVGNPFRIRRPEVGECVLDVGCGCGLDSFVASILVGPTGRTVGVDLTGEMLAVARQARADWPIAGLEFVQASIEQLSGLDGSFDFVVSNGVLNLVPDKDAAFRQIFRVLRPGGTFVAADLLLDDAIPEEVLADMDAWSN